VGTLGFSEVVVYGTDWSSGGDINSTAPLNVKFTPQNDGGAIAWRWDCNGDGIIDDTSRVISYTYWGGTYSVSLYAYWANGDVAVKTKTNRIVVTEVDPRRDASFSASARTGEAPLQVSFTDLSTAGATDLPPIVIPLLKSQSE
jgi:PKD repeat protein